MRNHICLLSLLLITATPALGDRLTSTGLPKPVLQDTRTKISYYLESDRRHIAAISPDGKLLWCCEVNAMNEKICPNWYISDFKLLTPNPGDGKDCLEVTIVESGYGGGHIDLKTGAYVDSGGVL